MIRSYTPRSRSVDFCSYRMAILIEGTQRYELALEAMPTSLMATVSFDGSNAFSFA